MPDFETEFLLEDGTTEIVQRDFADTAANVKRFYTPTQGKAALNQNLAFDRSPDEEAEVLKLSKQTGWTPNVVRSQKEEAANQARKVNINSLDPALTNFMAKTADNAALIKDDIPPLRRATGVLDRIQRDVGQLFQTDVSTALVTGQTNVELAPLYYNEFILGAPQTEEEKARKEELEANQTKIERDDLFGKIVTATAEQVPLLKATIEASLRGVPRGLSAGAIGGSFGGPATIVPGIVLGAKASAAFEAVQQIYVMESGLAAKEYSEFKDDTGKKLDPETIKYAAMLTGYINAGLELVGEVATLGTIPGISRLVSWGPRKLVKNALKQKLFRTAVKRIAKSFAGAITINPLQEMAQELVTIEIGEVAKIKDLPDSDRVKAEEFWSRILGAGEQGFYAAVGIGGAGSSIGVTGAAISKKARSIQAKNSKGQAEQFYNDHVELSERLDETKTKERSPDKIQELMEDGGMKQEVSVGGAEAQEFYQLKDNSEIFTKLGITEEEVNKASLSGQAIPIKLSEIHSILSLEESKEFLKIVQQNTDSLSFQDSQTISLPEELTRINENITEINREQTEFTTEKKRLEEEIFKAAKIRKIVRPNQTRIYAQGVAELWGNFSERMAFEGDQSAATTLKKISTDLSTFKDIKKAEEFAGVNGIGGAIPLGVTKIAPESFVISLFENANPSTLLHETGHVFFNEVLSLVNLGKASENLIKDFGTLKEWLKVDPKEGITVSQQDQFAEAFELYLREGKSPSKGLTPFFERFKKWLTTVYAKVKGSSIDVDLNNDVRGVFDRLLSAEQETNQFIEKNEMLVTEEQMNELDFSPEDKILFRRLMSGLTAGANQELQQKLAREYKANIKEWRLEASAEVAAKRGNNLFAETAAPGLRGFDLASSDLQTSIPLTEEVKTKWPSFFKGKGGFDPLILARRFGYENSTEMFDELIAVPSLKEQFKFINETEKEAIKVEKDSIRSLPINRLIAFLKETQNGINEKTLTELFGEQTVTELKAKSKHLVRKEGQSPYGLALEYGYESVTDMVDDLKQVEPRHDQVADLVSQKEKAHYLTFTPEDFFLKEESKKVEKIFETLGKFIGKKAGLEISTPQKVYKDQVSKEFATYQVKKAARTDRHLSDMRKALRNKDRAIKKGDFKEASFHVEQARLNYEFARKSKAVRDSTQKLKNLTKKAFKAKGKIEFDYWKNIVSLGNRFNLAKRKFKYTDVKNINNLIKSDEYVLNPNIEVPKWIADSDKEIDFRDLTVNQFEELTATINFLNKAGRDLISGENVLSDLAFKDLKTDLLSPIAKLPDKGDWGNIPPMQKVDDVIKTSLAHINTVYNITRNLDDFVQLRTGKPGLWERIFAIKLFKANSEQLRIKHILEEKQKEALKHLSLRAQELPAIIDTGVPLPENMAIARRRWSFEAIVSIALNMGNRENIEAVKEGYKLSESDLTKILDVLTDKDWDSILDLAKAVNFFKSDFFATVKRMVGFPPVEVKGDSFQTASGKKLPGWYYPLRADRTLNRIKSKGPDLGRFTIDLKQNFQDTTNAAIPAGAAIERKGFGGKPVKLDLSVLSQHLDFVALYISHAEVLKDLNKVLNDDDIAKAIDLKLGRPALKNLEQSLFHIATGGNEKLNIVDRFFEKVRGMAATFILAPSVTVPIKQPYSIFRFTQREGKSTLLKGTLDLTSQAIKFNPIAMANMIFDLSPYMKERSRFMDISMREGVKKAMLSKTLKGVSFEHVQTVAWIFIKTFDFITVMPSWWSAFLKGQGIFKGSKTQMADAVTYADTAIRVTQPSKETIDLTPLQLSRKSVGRTLSMFSTFSISNESDFRLWSRAMRQKKISPLKYLQFSIHTALVPPLLMTTMLAALGGELPDSEDLIWDLLLFRTGGYIGLREIAVAFKNKARGKPFWGEVETPLFLPLNMGAEILGGLYLAMAKDKGWKAALWSIGHLLSFGAKVPVSQYVKRGIRAVENYDKGKTDPLSILGQSSKK